MILKKSQLLILSSLLVFNFQSFAAAKNTKEAGDNSRVPPQDLAAPPIDELIRLTNQDFETIPANFKAESKRRPAGSSEVGTEDMLSKEYVQFRNQLLKSKSGADFEKAITTYNNNYKNIPNTARDLQFTIARLAAWLPMKGIIWRMTPMLHNTTTTQALLLASLKNFTEQVEINMPDSHVEAQMLFLTMPTADLLGKEFHTEGDFINFLATDVYQALKTAVERLSVIQMHNDGPSGKPLPIVFDGKIRFGNNAFNNGYDDYERFKILGEAERTASIARIHRRMYSISTMAAYNWNGHLALRKEIGKKFGYASAKATLFEALPGVDNTYLNSITREERTSIIRQYSKLYVRTPNGQSWMSRAYFHLHESGKYLAKTWDNIKNNTSDFVAQLDPEVFMARKEQVEAGIMNINKLVGAYGDGVSGRTKINGGLSGDEVEVDMKAFFEHSPEDFKKLLPIGFAGNEDLDSLKKLPEYKSLTTKKRDTMQITFPGKKPVTFRNYMYGRATKWDTSADAYGTLFPSLKGSEDVATAMRILNEARGTRILTSGLTMFIR